MKEGRKANKKNFETNKIRVLKRIIKIVEHLNNNKKGATIAGLKIICKNGVNNLSVSERTQISLVTAKK